MIQVESIVFMNIIKNVHYFYIKKIVKFYWFNINILKYIYIFNGGTSISDWIIGKHEEFKVVVS